MLPPKKFNNWMLRKSAHIRLTRKLRNVLKLLFVKQRNGPNKRSMRKKNSNGNIKILFRQIKFKSMSLLR
ncbi:hypothetical protein D3C75_949130 [compost metagenome]